MVNRLKKAMRWVGGVKEGAQQLMGKEIGRAVSSKVAQTVTATPASYAKGGLVRKTGLAKVHKGERVLTAKQVASLKKLLK